VRNGPVVVPGNVVDWRTTSWPRAEIGILRAGDRRRHAHDDDVRLGQVGRRRLHDPEARRKGRREALVRDVVDRRTAGGELLDARGVGVDPLDLEAGLDEGDRERQPDVAEADDRDAAIRGSGAVGAIDHGSSG
jgi:hypothetical protein